VRGLRRAEVAQLAGVSEEYYRRVEQGRAGNVSESVLASIATALRLDPDERRYLVEVSHPTLQGRTSDAPQVAAPELVEMLDALSLQPSVVVGRRMDVLASNALARVVFTDFATIAPGRQNIARFVFLDPVARERHVDWEDTAATMASILRRRAGERPDDPGLGELLDELLDGSREFRDLWSAERVELRGDGRREMRHPAVGTYRLRASTFTVPGDPEQTLVIHTAKRRSASEAALRGLAALAEPGED